MVAAQPAAKYDHRNLDAMVECSSGAKLYCGNIVAATNAQVLAEHDIVLVVNCQGPSTENKFEGDPRFEYQRLPVAMWKSVLAGKSLQGVLDFFLPTLQRIDRALSAGQSVLIHCLAGAHRASTVTGAYLLYKGIVEEPSKLQSYMERRRPIVQLLPGLYEALLVLDEALVWKKEQEKQQGSAPADNAVPKEEKGPKL